MNASAQYCTSLSAASARSPAKVWQCRAASGRGLGDCATAPPIRPALPGCTESNDSTSSSAACRLTAIDRQRPPLVARGVERFAHQQ